MTEELEERSSALADGLEERILRVVDSLTTKRQQLARVMLEDKLYLAFASAEELGRRAGVDAATVVRFCRRLGYAGFADLREEVRKSVPHFLTAVEKVSRTLEEPEQADDLLARVYAQDIRNIEETVRQNSPETVADAVAAIDRAARVFFIAMGRSGLVAEHLAHELALVGVPVHGRPRGVIEGVVDLAAAGPGDVVVAVSVWRYLKDMTPLVRTAREAGATTIVLTDSRLSQLAKLADILLVAAADTPEIGRSITALVALTNILATGIALANPERALHRLKRVDDFYDRVGLMTP